MVDAVSDGDDINAILNPLITAEDVQDFDEDDVVPMHALIGLEEEAETVWPSAMLITAAAMKRMKKEDLYEDLKKALCIYCSTKWKCRLRMACLRHLGLR